MQKIEFIKMHGLGNDFVIIDNRQNLDKIKNKETLKKIGSRNFGIGCDQILIIDSNERGEFFNIGGSYEIRNIDLVHKICNILNKIKPRTNNESYANLIKFVKDRPGHDFRYAINSSKISKTLGWSPQININLGLEETVRWYVTNETWWRKILSKRYKLERLGLNKA